jgi:hypothetical protein
LSIRYTQPDGTPPGERTSTIIQNGSPTPVGFGVVMIVVVVAAGGAAEYTVCAAGADWLRPKMASPAYRATSMCVPAASVDVVSTAI